MITVDHESRYSSRMYAGLIGHPPHYVISGALSRVHEQMADFEVGLPLRQAAGKAPRFMNNLSKD